MLYSIFIMRRSPFLQLSLSQRLRSLRIAAGLTQSELAKLFECSQGTLSKLENGVLEPTAFHLVRMRQHFGISVDAFLDSKIDFMAVADRFSNSAFSIELLKPSERSA